MTPLTYQAPGPSTWEQDPTHFPRPTTQYGFDVFREPMMKGFKEGSRRYGLLFSHLEPALINGFMYHKAATWILTTAPKWSAGSRLPPRPWSPSSGETTWISGIESSCLIRSSGTELVRYVRVGYDETRLQTGTDLSLYRMIARGTRNT
jgi:hypothetical protein